MSPLDDALRPAQADERQLRTVSQYPSPTHSRPVPACPSSSLVQFLRSAKPWLGAFRNMAWVYSKVKTAPLLRYAALRRTMRVRAAQARRQGSEWDFDGRSPCQ